MATRAGIAAAVLTLALVIGVGCASCPASRETAAEVSPVEQCVQLAPPRAEAPRAEAAPPLEEGRGAPPEVVPAPEAKPAPPPEEEAIRVAPGPSVRAAVPLGPTPPGLYRVQPGDSLWGISARAYGDPKRWRDIFEANRDAISDPGLIYPQQELKIPG